MSNQNLSTVAPVLDALHADAMANDKPVLAKLRDAKSDAEVADLRNEAFLPIDPPNGRLLHTLAVGRRPGRIVEFGASMGLSTIYLAAALRPGEEPVITTELDLNKVTRANENLGRAGLSNQVELRPGDAFETLKSFDEPISLLFLDGWKDLYLPMLQMLEPMLVDGAFVVADDTMLFAQQSAPLLDYLREPASGYATCALDLGDGMEIASRVTS